MSDASPEQPGLPLTLSDRERGRAVGYAAGMLHIVCERAHPPGQPLALTLLAPDGELALMGKSARSKRREDGTFDVQLKLVSLRRDQRIVLEAYYRVPSRE
jgi:hypothetical protein